ncbi:MAG: M3 family metallopeptidase [Gammaproteobacteria bacterium]
MNNPLLDDRTLPQFSAIKPEHVEPAIQQILDINREHLTRVLESGQEPDFDNTVLELEQMRDRLHHTWGPVSHLQGVKNSPELRAAFNACLPLLSRYETELAQNRDLFNLFAKIEKSLPENCGSGERVLIENALRDFRLAGVNLPPEKKKLFQEYSEELAQLQAKFEQNLLDSMAAWSHLEKDAERMQGIPKNVQRSAKKAAADEGKTGWLLQLNQPTYLAVLVHADNTELRELFYRAWVTRASDQGPVAGRFDNSKLMHRILELRDQASQLVGFESFAAYSLATKMAPSVDQVKGFLSDLVRVSRPVAEAEIKELETFAGHKLQAWDLAYYSEKLREERFSVSDAELRPYFPLPHVIEGLFNATQKLYGLSVEKIENFDAWRSDVSLYRVANEDGTTIGEFYVDFYTHKNKRAGAWMDECVMRKRIDGKLQIPVAHLVCNFAAPEQDSPALLNHDEVITLFHEFGHTLHHLLTTVDFPSISGINGVPWDAVELPSQFMENFAWNTEVLQNLSRHCETGASLPDELIEKLQASRVFQAGMQMLRQLEFALFDWELHSQSPDKIGGVDDVLRKVRNEVAVFQAPDFNRMAHGFSHVFGGSYAAGYYSYKWAEVLAADAFSAFIEEGLFNHEVATRFRREILEVGGSRDIGEAFEAFRGRPAKIDALLEQSGIVID